MIKFKANNDGQVDRSGLSLSENLSTPGLSSQGANLNQATVIARTFGVRVQIVNLVITLSDNSYILADPLDNSFNLKILHTGI